MSTDPISEARAVYDAEVRGEVLLRRAVDPDAAFDTLRAAILAADPRRAALETALRAIVDYETPFHYRSDEEHAEYMSCPECTRRRENRFFPGAYCDAHYRSLVMKYERLNDDERRYNTAHNMREIARSALKALEETAVEETRS